MTVADHHPSPGRDRVSIWVLLLAFAAGPAAWITQLVVSYGLAAHACYPSTEPWLVTPPPGWSAERPLLTVLNLLCLVIAGAGALQSWRIWRRTRDEKEGDAQSAMEIGEGRTRFIASCGVLFGVGFGVAILFATLEPVMIPSCWSFAE